MPTATPNSGPADASDLESYYLVQRGAREACTRVFPKVFVDANCSVRRDAKKTIDLLITMLGKLGGESPHEPVLHATERCSSSRSWDDESRMMGGRGSVEHVRSFPDVDPTDKEYQAWGVPLAYVHSHLAAHEHPDQGTELGHVVDVEEVPEMTMEDLYYIHLSATLARLQDPSSPRSERESLWVEAATHLRNYVNSIVANLSSGTSWTGDGWRGAVVKSMMQSHYRFQKSRVLDRFCLLACLPAQLEFVVHGLDYVPPLCELSRHPVLEAYCSSEDMVLLSRLLMVVGLSLARHYALVHRLTLCSYTDVNQHFVGWRDVLAISRCPGLLGTNHGACIVACNLDDAAHNPYHRMPTAMRDAISIYWMGGRAPTFLRGLRECLSNLAVEQGVVDWTQRVAQMEHERASGENPIHPWRSLSSSPHIVMEERGRPSHMHMGREEHWSDLSWVYSVVKSDCHHLPLASWYQDRYVWEDDSQSGLDYGLYRHGYGSTDSAFSSHEVQVLPASRWARAQAELERFPPLVTSNDSIACMDMAVDRALRVLATAPTHLIVGRKHEVEGIVAAVAFAGWFRTWAVQVAGPGIIFPPWRDRLEDLMPRVDHLVRRANGHLSLLHPAALGAYPGMLSILLACAQYREVARLDGEGLPMRDPHICASSSDSDSDGGPLDQHPSSLSTRLRQIAISEADGLIALARGTFPSLGPYTLIDRLTSRYHSTWYWRGTERWWNETEHLWGGTSKWIYWDQDGRIATGTRGDIVPLGFPAPWVAPPDAKIQRQRDRFALFDRSHRFVGDRPVGSYRSHRDRRMDMSPDETALKDRLTRIGTEAWYTDLPTEIPGAESAQFWNPSNFAISQWPVWLETNAWAHDMKRSDLPSDRQWIIRPDIIRPGSPPPVAPVGGQEVEPWNHRAVVDRLCQEGQLKWRTNISTFWNGEGDEPTPM